MHVLKRILFAFFMFSLFACSYQSVETPKKPPVIEEKVTIAEKTITPNKAVTAAETKKKPLVICIDPGHQRTGDSSSEQVGPGSSTKKPRVSSGTQGVFTGKPEYVLALEASTILGDMLKKRGFEVVYTRTTHDVNISNQERAEIANKHKASLFIRMHADGSPDQNQTGFFTIVPSSKNPYTTSIYKDSLLAAQSMLGEVKSVAAVKGNGISFRDDITGINWSKVPVVLIEMGFMTNPEEDKNLSDKVYLTKLMEQVSEGVLTFAGLDH